MQENNKNLQISVYKNNSSLDKEFFTTDIDRKDLQIFINLDLNSRSVLDQGVIWYIEEWEEYKKFQLHKIIKRNIEDIINE